MSSSSCPSATDVDCGCPENQGGFCFNACTYPTVGCPGGDTFPPGVCGRIGDTIPGWRCSEMPAPNGKVTPYFCINNYNQATYTTPSFNIDTNVAKNKMQCCLGELIGAQYCAPGWCPSTTTDDCELVMKTFCSNNLGNPSCNSYCSAEVDGGLRSDTSGGWCWGYFSDYCSIGTNLFTDKDCQTAINPSRPGGNGQHPAWSDAVAFDLCKAQPNLQYCGCLTSPLMGPASCFGVGCVNNAAAYRSNDQLIVQQNCPNYCQIIIDANDQGGNIIVDGNSFNINCPGQELKNYYNCVNGQCVLQDNGPYINDPTCGGKCTPGPGPTPTPPGPTTSVWAWVGLAIGILVLIGILAIAFYYLFRSPSTPETSNVNPSYNTISLPDVVPPSFTLSNSNITTSNVNPLATSTISNGNPLVTSTLPSNSASIQGAPLSSLAPSNISGNLNTSTNLNGTLPNISNITAF